MGALRYADLTACADGITYRNLSASAVITPLGASADWFARVRRLRHCFAASCAGIAELCIDVACWITGLHVLASGAAANLWWIRRCVANRIACCGRVLAMRAARSAVVIVASAQQETENS